MCPTPMNFRCYTIELNNIRPQHKKNDPSSRNSLGWAHSTFGGWNFKRGSRAFLKLRNYAVFFFEERHGFAVTWQTRVDNPNALGNANTP